MPWGMVRKDSDPPFPQRCHAVLDKIAFQMKFWEHTDLLMEGACLTDS